MERELLAAVLGAMASESREVGSTDQIDRAKALVRGSKTCRCEQTLYLLDPKGKGCIERQEVKRLCEDDGKDVQEGDRLKDADFTGIVKRISHHSGEFIEYVQ
jgi:hypothetical protein